MPFNHTYTRANAQTIFAKREKRIQWARKMNDDDDDDGIDLERART